MGGQPAQFEQSVDTLSIVEIEHLNVAWVHWPNRLTFPPTLLIIIPTQVVWAAGRNMTHGMRKGLTSYGGADYSLFLRKAFIKAMGLSDDALARPGP
jgi:hypothetical protein